MKALCNKVVENGALRLHMKPERFEWLSQAFNVTPSNRKRVDVDNGLELAFRWVHQMDGKFHTIDIWVGKEIYAECVVASTEPKDKPEEVTA